MTGSFRRHIVPTMPGPAAIAPEISLVEHELAAHGLHVARRHYRQAVDSFVDNRLKASNGQLRSCLENLLIELVHVAQANKLMIPRVPSNIFAKPVTLTVTRQSLIGLVGLSNDRGAHHGLTDEAEARSDFTSRPLSRDTCWPEFRRLTRLKTVM
jgi:hypothetical protein